MHQELKKILFIDDDPDIHTIIKFCFENTSIAVLSAQSAEEGIKKAMELQPDLILLDIMMPEMDGIEMLKAMKLIPHLSTIPVVVLTAKAQKSEVAGYFQYGVLDVIIKPFDPAHLAERLLQIWEKSQKN